MRQSENVEEKGSIDVESVNSCGVGDDCAKESADIEGNSVNNNTQMELSHVFQCSGNLKMLESSSNAHAQFGKYFLVDEVGYVDMSGFNDQLIKQYLN